MISDFIKKLQEKSDKSKEKILLSVVIVSAIISLAIWSLSFESYKAVFYQPLDDGMMKGLKASIDVSVNNIGGTNNATADKIEIQNSKIKNQNYDEELKDDEAMSDDTAENVKITNEEIKYYRLPVDED